MQDRKACLGGGRYGARWCVHPLPGTLCGSEDDLYVECIQQDGADRFTPRGSGGGGVGVGASPSPPHGPPSIQIVQALAGIGRAPAV